MSRDWGATRSCFYREVGRVAEIVVKLWTAFQYPRALDSRNPPLFLTLEVADPFRSW